MGIWLSAPPHALVFPARLLAQARRAYLAVWFHPPLLHVGGAPAEGAEPHTARLVSKESEHLRHIGERGGAATAAVQHAVHVSQEVPAAGDLLARSRIGRSAGPLEACRDGYAGFRVTPAEVPDLDGDGNGKGHQQDVIAPQLGRHAARPHILPGVTARELPGLAAARVQPRAGPREITGRPLPESLPPGRGDGPRPGLEAMRPGSRRGTRRAVRCTSAAPATSPRRAGGRQIGRASARE